MNFFDAQDKARRATRWLVVVYIISTILIVAGITTVVAITLFTMSDGSTAPPEFLAGIAILATAVILGSTLYKTARLSSGGGRVATDLGGTLIPPDVQDPLRRRLRNVVEEMAIASSVPVPEIYVLEEENGINAFAAGYNTGDAAIAVTRGCLELLDRDELQGVIAHEFSHVLNGDMRLNIRMMGVLFGIMVIGMLGRFLLHSQRFSAGRNKNASGILVVGLGLAILGWVGVFFSRLIKSSVSRQREYLADASAVQFTRQTDGIANALKKIGGYEHKSYIENVDAEEVSHMLFAGGLKRFSGMFATHPPLDDRIRALDPTFNESDFIRMDPRTMRMATEPEQAAGFAPLARASGGVESLSENIAEVIGRPGPEHIATAQKLRSSIPPELYDAAHSPEAAYQVAIALAIGDDQELARRQLQLVTEKTGEERADNVARFYRDICAAGPQYRLALLEIAFPMIRHRPVPQLEFLLELVRSLIELDGRVSLAEYCYFRILRSHLKQALDPAGAQKRNRVPKRKAQHAAVDLVRIIAEQGSTDADVVAAAMASGLETFGAWASEMAAEEARGSTLERLDDCLDTLAMINSAGQKTLLRAVTDTIAHDDKLTLREAELLRTVCASLDCPLPPLLESVEISSD